jgi:protein-tyrosine-phosphatase
MKIHLICTSNTFRSRLAATYLISKNIPGLVVTSSGIEAQGDLNGIISWYAQRTIEKNHLTQFEPAMWTQTTKEILDGQDLIIFMEKLHHNYCVEHFGYSGNNFEIWNIQDLNGLRDETDLDKISRSEEVYGKITKNIDELIVKLKLS